MLKKILKHFRNKLVARKINRENKPITERIERHRQNWEVLMRGGAMRDSETDKDCETEEVVVDYIDSRGIGQRPVTPMIIRPFGRWWWKI